MENNSDLIQASLRLSCIEELDELVNHVTNRYTDREGISELDVYEIIHELTKPPKQQENQNDK